MYTFNINKYVYQKKKSQILQITNFSPFNHIYQLSNFVALENVTKLGDVKHLMTINC